jgi:hypothetical protein
MKLTHTCVHMPPCNAIFSPHLPEKLLCFQLSSVQVLLLLQGFLDLTHAGLDPSSHYASIMALGEFHSLSLSLSLSQN